MDFGFYNIVLLTAVVILILTLTYIGVQMTGQAYTAPFPPVKATCPDYWTVTADGKGCLFPSNTSSPNAGSPGTSGYNTVSTYKDARTNANPLGSNGDAFNPLDAGWVTYQGNRKGATCGLRTWANTYGIVWDGVTNYNRC